MSVRAWFVSWLLSLASELAYQLGLQVGVLLDDQRIRLFAGGDNIDEYPWDKSQYINGNIFHEDYAAPIKVTVDDDDVHVLTSEKYKLYMKNHHARDLYGGGFPLGPAAMLAGFIVLLQFVTIVILFV